MKITCTINETDNGVAVVFSPSLEEIAAHRLTRKDKEMSAPEFYATAMANTVREISRKLSNYDPKKIIIPGRF